MPPSTKGVVGVLLLVPPTKGEGVLLMLPTRGEGEHSIPKAWAGPRPPRCCHPTDCCPASRMEAGAVGPGVVVEGERGVGAVGVAVRVVVAGREAGVRAQRTAGTETCLAPLGLCSSRP